MGIRFCLLPRRAPLQVPASMFKSPQQILSFSSPSAALEDSSGLQQILISSSLTALLGVVGFTLCYKCYLRRRLIRKFLKED